ISIVNSGSPKTIKLPRANTVLFSLLCSIGVIAAASSAVSVKLKRKTGQFAYIIESIKQLTRHESFAYDITTSSGTNLKGRSHQIVIVNADLSHQMHLIPDNSLRKASMTLTVFDTRSSKLRLIMSMLVYIVTLGRIRLGLHVIKDKEFKVRTKPANEVS